MPALGVGFSFRPAYLADLFLRPHSMDVLEVIADHYLENIADRQEQLELLCAHYTLLPHSLNLSLGGADTLDRSYVRRLCRLVQRLRPPWFSDHLAFTRAGGLELGHLAPVPLTKEALDVVCQHIHEVQDRAETLFILENISTHVILPGAEMTEADFLAEVVERTACGLLLDLTNVYTNAMNHGFSADAYLQEYPLEHTMQIHIAGGEWSRGTLNDTHSAPVPKEVWRLLEYTLKRYRVPAIILERDENLPPFESIVEETEMARSLWGCHAASE